MVIRSPIATAISGFFVAVLSVAPVWIYYHIDFLEPLVDPGFALMMSGIAVVFLSWFILTLLRPDRTEYFLVWLIVPIVSVFIVRVVFFPEWGAGPYPVNEHPFAMMFAGFVGIGLELLAVEIVKRSESYLDPIVRHKAVIILLVLLVPIGLIGFAYATPEEATITDVDPVFGCGDDGEYPDSIYTGHCPISNTHGFAISIDHDGEPLRVTVETPNGVINERWYQGSELGSDPVTVFLSGHDFGTVLPSVGPYTITVESIWGEVLDQRTYNIEQMSAASISGVTVIDAEEGIIDITVEYTGDYRITLPVETAFTSDILLDFHDSFKFEGTGEDTVRATALDRDGEPISLESGEYMIDLMFHNIDRSQYTFTVES